MQGTYRVPYRFLYTAVTTRTYVYMSFGLCLQVKLLGYMCKAYPPTGERSPVRISLGAGVLARKRAVVPRLREQRLFGAYAVLFSIWFFTLYAHCQGAGRWLHRPHDQSP